MNNTQHSIKVSLGISAQEYIRVYQGSAKTVSALDHLGRRVNFPVNILQPFVTRDGVNGVFIIEFTKDNKFKGIQRMRSK